MLADPQSVTVAGTALSLPRTAVGATSAVYNTPDQTTSLKVSQLKNGDNVRTIVSLQSTKIAADPLTAVSKRLTSTVSITVSSPSTGFSPTELKDQLVGLATLLTASSGATAIKVIGGEK